MVPPGRIAPDRPAAGMLVSESHPEVVAVLRTAVLSAAALTATAAAVVSIVSGFIPLSFPLRRQSHRIAA
jgi:hypothetical protein